MSEKEQAFLSFEEAESMIPDGEYIHTFRGQLPFLVGATWDRSDVLDAFKKHWPELAGEMATGMGHGIAFRDDHGWVFVETIENPE